jgi:hypothetical protein
MSRSTWRDTLRARAPGEVREDGDQSDVRDEGMFSEQDNHSKVRTGKTLNPEKTKKDEEKEKKWKKRGGGGGGKQLIRHFHVKRKARDTRTIVDSRSTSYTTLQHESCTH